jgi:hypothetical protein
MNEQRYDCWIVSVIPFDQSCVPILCRLIGALTCMAKECLQEEACDVDAGMALLSKWHSERKSISRPRMSDNSIDTQVLRAIHVGMWGSQHIHENYDFTRLECLVRCNGVSGEVIEDHWDLCLINLERLVCYDDLAYTWLIVDDAATEP